jgi:hypothetical protein
MFASEEERALDVPTVERGVGGAGTIEGGTEVFALEGEGTEDKRGFEVDEVDALDIGDGAGVDETGMGEVIFGGGAVTDFFLGGPTMAEGDAEVEEGLAIVGVYGEAGEAAGNSEAVGEVEDAGFGGVVKDAEGVGDALVNVIEEGDAGVAGRGEDVYGEGLLEEGVVFGAGEVFDAEGLVEVSGLDGAEDGDVVQSDVDVLGSIVAAGELVLKAEEDVGVEGAVELEADTAKVETVFHVAEGGLVVMALSDKGEVEVVSGADGEGEVLAGGFDVELAIADEVEAQPRVGGRGRYFGGGGGLRRGIDCRGLGLSPQNRRSEQEKADQ